MKAVIFESFGDISSLKEKEIPMPTPKKGEVRIQIVAAGFNPVDVKIRKGDFGGTPGIVLGADCSGIVDAVGEDVSDFQVGEEVFALVFGKASNGTYAEYTCLPIEFVCRKPKTLSFAEAASLPVVAMTAYRSVVATGCVKKGASLFFAGGRGGVGVIAIQLAQFLGAGEIFSTAGGEKSADFLVKKLQLKRENIFLYPNMSIEEMQEGLLQKHHGEKFFSTFDFVGGATKQLCLSLTDHQGHMVSIVPEKKGLALDLWARGESVAFSKNLSLHFIFLGSEAFFGTPQSWKTYQIELCYIKERLDRGELKVFAPEVFQGLNVSNVQNAHQIMEQGKSSGKIVMTIE